MATLRELESKLEGTRRVILNRLASRPLPNIIQDTNGRKVTSTAQTKDAGHFLDVSQLGKIDPYDKQLSSKDGNEISKVSSLARLGDSDIAGLKPSHPSKFSMDHKLASVFDILESPSGQNKAKDGSGKKVEHLPSNDPDSKKEADCFCVSERPLNLFNKKSLPKDTETDHVEVKFPTQASLRVLLASTQGVLSQKQPKSELKQNDKLSANNNVTAQVVVNLGKEVDSSGKDEQHSSKEGNGLSKFSSLARLKNPNIAGPVPSHPAKFSNGHKLGSIREDNESLSSGKKSKDDSGKEDKCVPLHGLDPKKEAYAFNDSKRKPQVLFNKKFQPEDTVQNPETVHVGVKSTRQEIRSGSSACKVTQGESSQKQPKSDLKQHDKLSASEEISAQVVVQETVSSPKHAKKSQVEDSLEDGPKTSCKRKRADDGGEFQQDKGSANQKQQDDGHEKAVPCIYHRLDDIMDLINQMQAAQEESYHNIERWQNHVDANFQTIASNQQELLSRIAGRARPLLSTSFFNASSQPRWDDPPEK